MKGTTIFLTMTEILCDLLDRGRLRLVARQLEEKWSVRRDSNPRSPRSRTGRDTRLRYLPKLTMSLRRALAGLVPNRMHWCEIANLSCRLVCQLVTILATGRSYFRRYLIARSRLWVGLCLTDPLSTD